MIRLETIARLLPVVGPVIAAGPEFKRLFDEALATFSTDDQEKLKEMYAAALDRADDAHERLQELVRRAG